MKTITKNTGTVRQNRVEKCPLPAPDKIKKEEHHYLHDTSSNNNNNNNIHICIAPYGRNFRGANVIVVHCQLRWKDNSIITLTVASNCHDAAPLGQAQ